MSVKKIATYILFVTTLFFAGQYFLYSVSNMVSIKTFDAKLHTGFIVSLVGSVLILAFVLLFVISALTYNKKLREGKEVKANFFAAKFNGKAIPVVPFIIASGVAYSLFNATSNLVGYLASGSSNVSFGHIYPVVLAVAAIVLFVVSLKVDQTKLSALILRIACVFTVLIYSPSFAGAIALLIALFFPKEEMLEY